MAENLILDPTAETEKKRVQVRPWNESQRKPEIPWSQRTYALDLSTGRIVALAEEWIPEENESGRLTGRMVKKLDSVPDNNGIWIKGEKVKYPVLTYKQTVQLFDEAEERNEPLTVAFVRLFGRNKLTLDLIAHVGRLPKFYADQERREAARKRAADRESDEEIFAAAGVDIPSGVGAPQDEDAMAMADLAKTAVGGVSSQMPKGVKLRGRSLGPKLGEEGAIGPMAVVPAK